MFVETINTIGNLSNAYEMRLCLKYMTKKFRWLTSIGYSITSKAILTLRSGDSL
jgi:hypothetical protein